MDLPIHQLMTYLSGLNKRDNQNVQYWGGSRNSLKTLDHKNQTILYPYYIKFNNNCNYQYNNFA